MSETPQVTRSAAAWSASAAGRVARTRSAQPNGWWGMALFLCAEVALFGTLLGSYFYLNFGSHQWPPAGIKPPSVALFGSVKESEACPSEIVAVAPAVTCPSRHKINVPANCPTAEKPPTVRPLPPPPDPAAMKKAVANREETWRRRNWLRLAWVRNQS